MSKGSSFFSYLIVMGLSAVFGFLKFIVLSQFFSVENFGDYISIYGVAMFCAALVSFGTLENTLKQYPELWERADLDSIAQSFQTIIFIISKRYVFFALLLFASKFFLQLTYGIDVIIGALLVSWVSTFLLVFASIIRASHLIPYQNKFYFCKSLSIFMCASLAAYFLGWKGALYGELLGAVIACVYSAFLCKKLGIYIYLNICFKSKVVESVSGGGKIYIAFMLSSVCSQLDKLFINQFVGAAQSGVYGFVNLLPQASALLVNIITQRVGTLFIKLNVQKVKFSTQLGVLFKWFVGFFLFMSLALIMILLLEGFGVLDDVFKQYDMSEVMLLFAGLSAILQVYAMLEFFLIAQNDEKGVLISSVCSSLFLLVSFVVTYALSLHFEWYFVCVFFSKGINVLMQLFFITKIMSRHKNA